MVESIAFKKLVPNKRQSLKPFNVISINLQSMSDGILSKLMFHNFKPFSPLIDVKPDLIVKLFVIPTFEILLVKKTKLWALFEVSVIKLIGP